jgi:hypothetical protein
VNIKLHIERLILEDMPLTGAQGSHVKAAVETELTRLLTTDGLSHELQTGGAVPRLPTRSMRLTHNLTPARVGKQIAQSVYGGIGKAK